MEKELKWIHRLPNSLFLVAASWIATLLLAASCGICKHCPTRTETNIKDSVAIHWVDSIRIIDRLVVRDSLVLVPLPVESSQTVLPVIMPSHLETSLAESDAYVDSTGLHHTIKNKDTPVKAHVPVTEHHHYEEHSQESDTACFHSDSQKETVTEYVDKTLSWWQRFRIGAFWWLILALALTNIDTIIKLIKKIVL